MGTIHWKKGVSILCVIALFAVGCDTGTGSSSDNGANQENGDDGGDNGADDGGDSGSGGDGSNGIVEIQTVPVIDAGVRGTFLMGDPTVSGGAMAKPVHTVTLTVPYAMSVNEVTNAQVAAILNWALGSSGDPELAFNSVSSYLLWDETELLALSAASSQLGHDNGRLLVDEGFGDYPATCLTWYGAIAVAYYLNLMEGREQPYDLSNWSYDHSAAGWRLPTEAEWEFAARGGLQGKDTLYAGSNDLDEVAWTQLNCDTGYNSQFTSGLGTNPVMRKRPNELGIYDLSGNIAEWVWDTHDSYEAEPTTDPTGPHESSSTLRVTRGNSWLNQVTSDTFSVYRRDLSPAGSRGGITGLRLVLNE